VFLALIPLPIRGYYLKKVAGPIDNVAPRDFLDKVGKDEGQNPNMLAISNAQQAHTITI